LPFYFAIFRARSNAWLRKGHVFTIDQVPGGEHPCAVSLWTAYEDAGFAAQIPRELIIEVKGEASSLDDAISAYQQVAQGFANFTAFVVNAPVDQARLHVAYDASVDQNEHEFMEVFGADERELLPNGRWVDEEELGAFLRTGPSHVDWTRLARAIGHYTIALDNWFYGGETLALAHLYMAAEALTPAMIRSHLSNRGLQGDEQAKLADQLGIQRESTEACPHCGHVEPPKWRMKLEQWHRLNVVFRGDNDTYRKARRASDSFEHGFGELAEVRRYATGVIDSTFSYIRQAILDVIPLADEVKASIENRRPLDVRSLRKIVRGTFIGEANKLPAAGQVHPYLRWESSLNTLSEDQDGNLRAEFNEQWTIICGEGIEFRGESFELRGRFEQDKEHIQIQFRQGETEQQVVRGVEAGEEPPEQ
jgi:hypothetical protein